jgi:inorganic pyrophosphatase
VKTIEDLPAAQRQAMVRFFSTYKNAEGKKTSVPGFADVAEARRLLQETHAAYRQKAP